MNRKRSLLQNILLTLAILTVLFFCLFPFIQILSTSLKHQFDWGNPSLLPVKLNFDAYKELLGFVDSTEEQIPETIKTLLKNPLITKEQREKILSRYVSTSDVFPFPRFFLNTFLLSSSAASISLALAVFGAYAFSRLRFGGRTAIQRSILFVYMVGGRNADGSVISDERKSGFGKNGLGLSFQLAVDIYPANPAGLPVHAW